MTSYARWPRPKRINGWYWDNGIPYPSVTTITKVVSDGSGLQEWYGRLGLALATQRRDEAADIGTDAHRLVRVYLQGHRQRAIRLSGLLPPEHPTRQSFIAWLVWAKYRDLQPILLERYICNRVHGYAGTFDYYGFVARCLGGVNVYRRELLDWKTSNTLRKPMQLQPPAYRMALIVNDLPVDGCGLLRFGTKDWTAARPTQEIDLSSQQDALFDRFLDAKKLFNWLRRYPKTMPLPKEGDFRQKGRFSRLTPKGWIHYPSGYGKWQDGLSGLQSAHSQEWQTCQN